MNTLMYISAIGALVASTAAGVPATVGEVEDRTFQSVAVTQDGQPRPLLPGTVIQLRITDGGLHARAGGNLIAGQVTVESTHLVVTGVHTMQAPYGTDQYAQDTWLAEFIGAGPAWTQHDDELLLWVDGTEIRLAGLPEADRPLLETYWLVESTSRPGSPPSPARVPAHLVFQDDEVQGALSCNWLSGRAVVADTTITADGLGTTKRMCQQEDILLEIAIFGVLQGEVAFDLDADRLDLTGPDGRSLHLRAPF
ncbi:META domain-containing protein [Plantactinospora solaniradicis]|uniref:META domain-containing protein n=1 Tax=Plantactinospora solaniradicis TaxID=1723736 RepID=A0ABW1K8K6_9ACTN